MDYELKSNCLGLCTVVYIGNLVVKPQILKLHVDLTIYGINKRDLHVCGFCMWTTSRTWKLGIVRRCLEQSLSMSELNVDKVQICTQSNNVYV